MSEMLTAATEIVADRNLVRNLEAAKQLIRLLEERENVHRHENAALRRELLRSNTRLEADLTDYEIDHGKIVFNGGSEINGAYRMDSGAGQQTRDNVPRR